MNIKHATAKALSDAKAERNLTLADIGKRMEISPQAVGEYMRGDKHPSVSMFARFCQAMGADPAEVLAEIMNAAEEEEMKEFAIVTEKRESTSGPTDSKPKKRPSRTAKWEWEQSPDRRRQARPQSDGRPLWQIQRTRTAASWTRFF